MSNEEKISKHCVEHCPINQTLELIRKKWVIEIVRDMFFGKCHFNEFKENKSKLSNKVLSTTLKSMEQNGLIIKVQNNEKNKFDTTYKLTTKGKNLNKIIYELSRYSCNLCDFEKFEDDVDLTDDMCKKVFNVD